MIKNQRHLSYTQSFRPTLHSIIKSSRSGNRTREPRTLDLHIYSQTYAENTVSLLRKSFIYIIIIIIK